MNSAWIFQLGLIIHLRKLQSKSLASAYSMFFSLFYLIGNLISQSYATLMEVMSAVQQLKHREDLSSTR